MEQVCWDLGGISGESEDLLGNVRGIIWGRVRSVGNLGNSWVEGKVSEKTGYIGQSICGGPEICMKLCVAICGGMRDPTDSWDIPQIAGHRLWGNLQGSEICW